MPTLHHYLSLFYLSSNLRLGNHPAKREGHDGIKSINGVMILSITWIFFGKNSDKYNSALFIIIQKSSENILAVNVINPIQVFHFILNSTNPFIHLCR